MFCFYRLTLTFDVFKSSRYEGNIMLYKWLTLTFDVFKWFNSCKFLRPTPD